MVHLDCLGTGGIAPKAGCRVSLENSGGVRVNLGQKVQGLCLTSWVIFCCCQDSFSNLTNPKLRFFVMNLREYPRNSPWKETKNFKI